MKAVKKALFYVSLLVVVTCLFLPNPLRAAVIKDVQSGAVTINAVSGIPVNVALTPVVPANAFLIFTTNPGSFDSPVSTMVTGQITSGGVSVSFSTAAVPANPINVVIQWYVAEFSSGVTVIQGTTPITATTTNIPLSPANQNSVPIISYMDSDTTYGAGDFVDAAITNSGGTLQLNLDGNATVPTSATVNYQVVQFDNSVSVQSGVSPVEAPDVGIDVPLTTTVNPDQSWLLFTNTSSFASTDMRQSLMMGTVATNSLSFNRGRSGASVLNLSWSLIQFLDGTTVQSGAQNFQTTDFSSLVPLSTIVNNQTIASGGGLYYSGGDVLSVNSTSPGVAMGTYSLGTGSTSTNLQIARANDIGTGVGSGAESADMGWFVVQFPLATSTPTNTASSTATNTATETATNTATNSSTNSPTSTPTSSATNTATSTPTFTATSTPQARLVLSWNDEPTSQNYLFNQTNVTGIQVVLTALGQEPV
ncbi:MAG TPA: hypothetical protein VN963_08355, partial [bacterium]|nr:hypothetical protein [bacterium]